MEIMRTTPPKRNDEIREKKGKGWENKALSKHYRLTERRIRQILAETGDNYLT